MKVYLDDERIAPKGWLHVFTYEQAVEVLKTGKVEVISLDNDLGTKKEGYDVAAWIERQVYETNFRPPKIQIHTANPVASQKIVMAREAIKRVAKEKSTYRGEPKEE